MSLASSSPPTAVFALHDLVVDELRRNPSPDPYEIAAAVIGRVRSLSDMRAALAVTLPLYVRTVASHSGVAPFTIVTGGDQRTTDTQAPGVPSGPGTGRPHTDATAGARHTGTLRRHAWLAKRVPAADGVYKFVGDFDPDDCAAAAAMRDKHAAENAAAADLWRRRRTALKRHKAGTLKELPGKVLEGLG